MNRILCVEDAPDVLVILEATLRGYQSTFASSIAEALKALEREKFDLLLLDIELPDGSSFELLASLSDRLQGVPVIFLTGKSDFASKVSAFALGADDFILKPFDPKELKLRINSKLRKASLAPDDIVRIGPLICNLQEHRIYKAANNEVIELTSLEFRIFQLLARRPTKIFPRSEILDRAWGSSSSVTDRAVDVHISNIRKKLVGTGVTIDAVIGTGYRILVE